MTEGRGAKSDGRKMTFVALAIIVGGILSSLRDSSPPSLALPMAPPHLLYLLFLEVLLPYNILVDNVEHRSLASSGFDESYNLAVREITNARHNRYEVLGNVVSDEFSDVVMACNVVVGVEEVDLVKINGLGRIHEGLGTGLIGCDRGLRRARRRGKRRAKGYIRGLVIALMKLYGRRYYSPSPSFAPRSSSPSSSCPSPQSSGPLG